MQRSRRDIESALERKGFERREGDHSRFIYHTPDGKKTKIKTKTSHGSGSKSIGDSLLGVMAKQCFLTKSDFLDLVDCPLDREGFEVKARERGGI